MAAKTPIKKKAKSRRRVRADKTSSEGAGKPIVVVNGGTDEDHAEPVYLHPETREERERRLAARKALTLQAFQRTYENRRRRKAS